MRSVSWPIPLVATMVLLAEAATAGIGETWREVLPEGPSPVPGRCGHAALVFKEKLWVIGGFQALVGYAPIYGDVWSTPDGVHWEQVTPAAPFEPIAAPGAVVFHDKMWLVGGTETWYGSTTARVLSSDTGTTWSLESESPGFTPRSQAACAVFHDRIWLIAGKGDWYDQFGDVWSSGNGVDWRLEVPAAPFGTREGARAIVFRDRLWLFGGYNDDSELGWKVWSSPDGVQWSSAGYPPFHSEYSSLAVYRDRLWTMTTDSYFSAMNDRQVWSTVDGVTWLKPSPPPVIRPADFAAGVVFHKAMWVLGGEGRDPSYAPPVRASGEGPWASLDRDSVDFGSVSIRDNIWKTETITLRNEYPRGWEDLRLQGMSLLNDTSGSFRLQAVDVPDSIPVGSQRQFEVAFHPAVAGNLGAVLVLETNDLDHPRLQVSLSGRGNM